MAIAIVAMSNVGGCGKSPSSSETVTPMTKSLGSYDTVVITASAEKPGDAAHTERLAHAVQKSIEAKGTFATVTLDSAGVQAGVELRVTLLPVESGSQVARAMNMGGEAEMTVRCELVEIGSAEKIGAFSVTGNSSRQVRTSVNGVDTSIADDLNGRAIGAVADEVASYLATAG